MVGLSAVRQTMIDAYTVTDWYHYRKPKVCPQNAHTVVGNHLTCSSVNIVTAVSMSVHMIRSRSHALQRTRAS